jgi:hypothetical protein
VSLKPIELTTPQKSDFREKIGFLNPAIASNYPSREAHQPKTATLDRWRLRAATRSEVAPPAIRGRATRDRSRSVLLRGAWGEPRTSGVQGQRPWRWGPGVCPHTPRLGFGARSPEMPKRSPQICPNRSRSVTQKAVSRSAACKSHGALPVGTTAPYVTSTPPPLAPSKIQVITPRNKPVHSPAST